MAGIVYRPDELDQIIQFESEVLTPDGQGGETITRVNTLGDIWAKVKPKSGGERENFDQLQNPFTCVFVVRNRSDISEKDLIIWDDEEYNIRSIPKRGSRVLYLEIVAERGVAQ